MLIKTAADTPIHELIPQLYSSIQIIIHKNSSNLFSQYFTTESYTLIETEIIHLAAGSVRAQTGLLFNTCDQVVETYF